MKTLATFNEEQVTPEAISKLRVRRAVRGVVMDRENNVAVIFAKNNNYYELPGGGVDIEETFEEGVTRECKEETGCDTEILYTIGKVFEVRKTLEMINESVGFVLAVAGDKGAPSLEPDEVEEGMEVRWMPIEDAIKVVQSSDIANKGLYDKYVMERDVIFLREAVKILKV